MANVNLTIDGKAVSVPSGTTILAAAGENGIRIPTLCFLEGLEPHASCRMCVVEVEGARTFQHACAAQVREGMVVHTNTEALRASRRLTLQLLLSNHSVDCHHCLRIGSSKCDDLDPRFCEMCFFCDCVKDGFCELQALAREYKVDKLPFEQKHALLPLDVSSAIVRDPNKCIKCRRCVDVCGKVQTVHNLAASGRGSEVVIGTAFSKPMAESACIGCGRCVEVCPTGAIFAQEHKDEIVYHAHRADTTAIAQVDSALIEELERIWKYKTEPVTVEQLVGSLKKIGFSAVVDAKDARETAQAEAEALLDKRLKSGKAILTDNAAAVKLLKRDFGQYSERFVFYLSALSVFGSRAKATFAPDEQKVKTCAFTPFGADASEAADTGCVDYVVNPRELYRIMVRTGSEPNPRRVGKPDRLPHASPSGKYGRLLEPVRWSMDAEPEYFELSLDGRTLSCAICRNPAQLRRVLADKPETDIIRVTA